MSKKITRKNFLKTSAIGSISAGLSAVLPQVALGADNSELATLIDIRKCIGCESCVYACREENEARYPKPEKPFPKMYPSRVKVSDWSDKKDVTDRLTPYNWLFIQSAEVESGGKKIELNIPRRCMHCQNPPCANLCPWGAANKHENGITTIDPEVCLGGAKCQKVCPWDIPQRQTGTGLYLDLLPAFAGNGVMYKCRRCYDKVQEGEQPACIKECPENVQKIGPRDEILKEAKAIAKEINGYIYGAEENGGTNTFYISPVPFDKINKAIEKGAGKPHLKPVKDTMASTEHFSKALMIAPVAGIASAVIKNFNLIKKLIK